MVDPWQAAFRPDAWWDIDGRAAALAFEESSPLRGEDHYEGFFWVGRPSPRHPRYIPAKDRSSDQPALEFRDAPYGIRPVVPIPRQSHTPPPCQVQPHFNPASPAYGTTGVIPPAYTGPSADSGVWAPPLPLIDRSMAAWDFPAGVLTSVGDDMVIP